jgi:hypothetical protein
VIFKVPVGFQLCRFRINQGGWELVAGNKRTFLRENVSLKNLGNRSEDQLYIGQQARLSTRTQEFQAHVAAFDTSFPLTTL